MGNSNNILMRPENATHRSSIWTNVEQNSPPKLPKSMGVAFAQSRSRGYLASTDICETK